MYLFTRSSKHFYFFFAGVHFYVSVYNTCLFIPSETFLSGPGVEPMFSISLGGPLRAPCAMAVVMAKGELATTFDIYFL